MRYQINNTPKGYEFTIMDNPRFIYNLNNGMWDTVGAGRTQGEALEDFKRKYFKKLKELENFGEKLKNITDFEKELEEDWFFYYAPDAL